MNKELISEMDKIGKNMEQLFKKYETLKKIQQLSGEIVLLLKEFNIDSGGSK